MHPALGLVPPDPDVLGHRRVVVGLEVVGAVLEALELRGVRWLFVVDEVRPKPSCSQRSWAAPRASRARLRTAWKATCGSSAHAWMQRSPSELAGSSSSPGSGPSGRSLLGRRAARPKRSLPPSSKTVAPSPKVIVSLAGASPTASPVSSGGAAGGSLPPIVFATVSRAAASVQVRSRSWSSLARSSVRSKAPKTSRSWAGVAIPAWCSP